jgi:hypothetical protein
MGTDSRMEAKLSEIEARQSTAAKAILRFATEIDREMRLTALIRALSACIHECAREHSEQHPEAGDPVVGELKMARHVAGGIICAAGGEWDFETSVEVSAPTWGTPSVRRPAAPAIPPSQSIAPQSTVHGRLGQALSWTANIIALCVVIIFGYAVANVGANDRTALALVGGAHCCGHMGRRSRNALHPCREVTEIDVGYAKPRCRAWTGSYPPRSEPVA